MPLVYACVGRVDAVAGAASTSGDHQAAKNQQQQQPHLLIIAQHACGGVEGNLEAVAAECFDSFGGSDSSFTVAVDGYNFNFFATHGGLVFCVAADDAYARELAFALARRLADSFVPRFAERASRARGRLALQKRAGPLLAAELSAGNARPAELYGAAMAQRQVEEVKGILIANLDWLEGALAPASGGGGGGGYGYGGHGGYDLEAAAGKPPPWRMFGGGGGGGGACSGACGGLKLALVLAALALLATVVATAACLGTGRCGGGGESS